MSMMVSYLSKLVCRFKLSHGEILKRVLNKTKHHGDYRVGVETLHEEEQPILSTSRTSGAIDNGAHHFPKYMVFFHFSDWL